MDRDGGQRGDGQGMARWWLISSGTELYYSKQIAADGYTAERRCELRINHKDQNRTKSELLRRGIDFFFKFILLALNPCGF